MSPVIDVETDAASRLGAHVRSLRHARGLTLVQVADRTGLSHPFLSQLERGIAQPSLGSLRRIAVALGTSPIELVAAAEDPAEAAPAVEVHRAGEGLGAAGFAVGEARMLAHAARPFHPIDYVADNTEPGEVFVHEEDEFLYVVSGRVWAEIDAEARMLEPGDSAYYGGGTGHRWWSADGGEFRLLVVKQRPPGR